MASGRNEAAAKEVPLPVKTHSALLVKLLHHACHVSSTSRPALPWIPPAGTSVLAPGGDRAPGIRASAEAHHFSLRSAPWDQIAAPAAAPWAGW